eukprot:246807-Chlamydomonas_euryale.AAC.4
MAVDGGAFDAVPYGCRLLTAFDTAAGKATQQVTSAGVLRARSTASNLCSVLPLHTRHHLQAERLKVCVHHRHVCIHMEAATTAVGHTPAHGRSVVLTCEAGKDGEHSHAMRRRHATLSPEPRCRSSPGYDSTTSAATPRCCCWGAGRGGDGVSPAAVEVGCGPSSGCTGSASSG